MLFWAIVFIATAVVLYAIIIFNSLVRTRHMANEAWSGIDVQLKRRSNSFPIWSSPSEGMPRTNGLSSKR